MTAELSKASDQKPPEWRISKGFVPYEEAVAAMDERVAAIINGDARELAWCLEHPPLYTAGASAKDGDLVETGKFPVYRTPRGGQMTYHGPGQLVIYVMSDLRTRGRDVNAHVARLEEWIIKALADFGVQGERRKGRVGIWVVRDNGREEKIAAIGVRVKKWVTYHGLSFNVCPDLDHYKGIVPCGLPEFGTTSLWALGVKASMGDVIKAFRNYWADVFGIT